MLLPQKDLKKNMLEINTHEFTFTESVKLYKDRSRHTIAKLTLAQLSVEFDFDQ